MVLKPSEVTVGGRLPDEIQNRVETVVGVVEKNIPLAQLAEKALFLFGKLQLAAFEVRVFQGGIVQIGYVHQPGPAQRPGPGESLEGFQTEAADQLFDQMLGGLGQGLQPDDLAEPPLVQDVAHRRQQIVGLVLLITEVGVIEHLQPFGEQLGLQGLAPEYGRPVQQMPGPAAHGLQLLQGAEPVYGPAFHPQLILPGQAGHPDHEEFIEVAVKNGQESDSLQKRVAPVGRLLQYLAVELQPVQLPVEKQLFGLPFQS